MQLLTQQHKQARMAKAQALRTRFCIGDQWKHVWFSDEAVFHVSSPLNRQNERIYREVHLKMEIPNEALLVQIDKQQPSIMCYGAVSWFGKTQLFFVEGFADGQDDVPEYRKKLKTVNQEVYRNEMCPLMFADINRVMRRQHWIWQQDGAKPHIARDTVAWLRNNTNEFIEPGDWPSKSPDLNVMDYFVWGTLLQYLQLRRKEVTSLHELKNVLMEAWNNIPIDVIKSATQSWMRRLAACNMHHGDHFEHLL